MKKVLLTGAGGQIAYSLIFRLIHLDLFSEGLQLVLYDLPQMEKKLEGIALEIQDCGLSHVEVVTTSDLNQACKKVNLALLIGAKPRGPGMERGDLLQENAKIFVQVGQALNTHASRDVKALVVGNPCNTNALITIKHAPDLNPYHIHAMVSLDALRARYQVAQKANVSVNDVMNLAVWGNHSATQVPDLVNATIQGRKVLETLDQSWYETELLPRVQKRGAEIIRVLGHSSAASAANAVIHWVKGMFTKTEASSCFSSAIYSKNNPYGIDDDLMFGFPLISDGLGNVSIKTGFEIPSMLQEKIKKTEQELQEERSLIQQLA